MQVSPRIKDLIHKMEIGKLKGVIEASTQDGMLSFDQSVYDLYTQGLISMEDALTNADSANDLRLRMMVSKLMEDEHPDYVVAAFEGGKTFRHGWL